MGQERGQASAEHNFGDPCDEQGYVEAFGRMTLALEHRPMLAVDRNFSVLWQCDRTDRLLDSPLPLCVRDGKLVLEDELGPGRFKHFLNSLDDVPRRFLVRGRNTTHWVILNAWRHPEFANEIFLICNLSIPHCRVEASGMASDFSLTRAETSVLALFARLMSPKEIASDLGVSLSTVRSHIKQIYAKTGVQTGVQLTQLVHAYCAI